MQELELQNREAVENKGSGMDERMDMMDERLDGMEDMLRDIRRHLTGRRSTGNAEVSGREQTWQE